MAIKIKAGSPYPRWTGDEPTKRRFRLWAAKHPNKQKEDKDVPWRRYSSRRRAHDQALLLVRWEKEGTIFHVYDVENGDLLGEYQRHEKTVSFINIRTPKD